MYLVAEPVRLMLEAFGACYKQRLSTDMAQKHPKFDGFTLLICFIMYQLTMLSKTFTMLLNRKGNLELLVLWFTWKTTLYVKNSSFIRQSVMRVTQYQ